MKRVPDTRAIGWILLLGQCSMLAIVLWECARLRQTIRRKGAIGIMGMTAGGLAMALAARTLGPGLRAHPSPPEGAVLHTGGPYRLVRHPMYSGLLLFAAGAAASARTTRALAGFFGLVLLLNTKARFEERLLMERFPEYAAYASRMPRFVPRGLRR